MVELKAERKETGVKKVEIFRVKSETFLENVRGKWYNHCSRARRQYGEQNKTDQEKTSVGE